MNKESKDSTERPTFPGFGPEQAKAAAFLQKDLLEAYEQLNRAWFARVQSEAALWTDLAAKLLSTRSPSEAVEAYTKCVAQQMQMSAEDGQRLINDAQQMTQKITKSLSGGMAPRGGGT